MHTGTIPPICSEIGWLGQLPCTPNLRAIPHHVPGISVHSGFTFNVFLISLDADSDTGQHRHMTSRASHLGYSGAGFRTKHSPRLLDPNYRIFIYRAHHGRPALHPPMRMTQHAGFCYHLWYRGAATSYLCTAG